MIGDVTVTFTVIGRVAEIDLTREQAEHLLRQLRKALKVTGKVEKAAADPYANVPRVVAKP